MITIYIDEITLSGWAEELIDHAAVDRVLVVQSLYVLQHLHQLVRLVEVVQFVCLVEGLVGSLDLQVVLELGEVLLFPAVDTEGRVVHLGGHGRTGAGHGLAQLMAVLLLQVLVHQDQLDVLDDLLHLVHAVGHFVQLLVYLALEHLVVLLLIIHRRFLGLVEDPADVRLFSRMASRLVLLLLANLLDDALGEPLGLRDSLGVEVPLDAGRTLPEPGGRHLLQFPFSLHQLFQLVEQDLVSFRLQAWVCHETVVVVQDAVVALHVVLESVLLYLLVPARTPWTGHLTLASLLRLDSSRDALLVPQVRPGLIGEFSLGHLAEQLERECQKDGGLFAPIMGGEDILSPEILLNPDHGVGAIGVLDREASGAMCLVFVVSSADGLDDVVLELLGPLHRDALIGLDLSPLDHLDAAESLSLDSDHVVVDALPLSSHRYHSQQVAVSHTAEQHLLVELQLVLQFLVLVLHENVFVSVLGDADENAVLQEEQSVFPDSLSSDCHLAHLLPPPHPRHHLQLEHLLFEEALRRLEVSEPQLLHLGQVHPALQGFRSLLPDLNLLDLLRHRLAALLLEHSDAAHHQYVEEVFRFSLVVERFSFLPRLDLDVLLDLVDVAYFRRNVLAVLLEKRESQAETVHFFEVPFFLLLLESEEAESFEAFLVAYFLGEVLETIDLDTPGIVCLADALSDAVYFGESPLLVIQMHTQVEPCHRLSAPVIRDSASAPAYVCTIQFVLLFCVHDRIVLQSEGGVHPEDDLAFGTLLLDGHGGEEASQVALPLVLDARHSRDLESRVLSQVLLALHHAQLQTLLPTIYLGYLLFQPVELVPFAHLSLTRPSLAGQLRTDLLLHAQDGRLLFLPLPLLSQPEDESLHLPEDVPEVLEGQVLGLVSSQHKGLVVNFGGVVGQVFEQVVVSEPVGVEGLVEALAESGTVTWGEARVLLSGEEEALCVGQQGVQLLIVVCVGSPEDFAEGLLGGESFDTVREVEEHLDQLDGREPLGQSLPDGHLVFLTGQVAQHVRTVQGHGQGVWVMDDGQLAHLKGARGQRVHLPSLEHVLAQVERVVLFQRGEHVPLALLTLVPASSSHVLQPWRTPGYIRLYQSKDIIFS